MLVYLIGFNGKLYKDSDIPESLYRKQVTKACSYVDLFTYNRINEYVFYKYIDKIEQTICEIVKLLIEQDNLKNKIIDDTNSNKEIASETVGRHSVTYANKTIIQANKILSEEELKKSCYEICYRYLIYTGLMDRSFK